MGKEGREGNEWEYEEGCEEEREGEGRVEEEMRGIIVDGEGREGEWEEGWEEEDGEVRREEEEIEVFEDGRVEFGDGNVRVRVGDMEEGNGEEGERR